MTLLGNDCGSGCQFDDSLRDLAVAAARHHTRIDRAIWPLTTHVDELRRLCVGGVALTDVADEFGTPTYVIDEADFRQRIRRYRAALPEAPIYCPATACAEWHRCDKSAPRAAVKRFSTASDPHVGCSWRHLAGRGVVRGDIDTRGDALDYRRVGKTDAGIESASQPSAYAKPVGYATD
jgi:hypothetical protein